MKIFNSLVLIFVFIQVQGSSLLENSTEQQNIILNNKRNENRNIFKQIQNESEDENGNENSNETETSEMVNRRRITPIMFMNIYVNKNSSSNVCINAEEDFPRFFTDEERRCGAVIIAFAIGIYCFILLAIICESYFLPCVERICEVLNLSQDVAAATFMAMATSAPELFVNVIGTFITQSDIGIGTVVGSSMFNTLGVAALGSLAARNPIQVDWWPVTRDCSIYVIAISLLVVMTWDGYIYWYEGMILFIIYFVYFVVMFNNDRISKFVRGKFRTSLSRENSTNSTNELTKCEKSESSLSEPRQSVIFYIEEPRNYYSEYKEKPKLTKETEVSEIQKICTLPNGKWAVVKFFLTWPLKFVLLCTIPNPKTKPRLFPITFMLCIVYIGVNSYVVSWMITVIGHTFQISDAVLGLTFLAAGGCLPEAISIIIMSRKGEGRMGVSNALGANTMNILLSLGLPWFIKTMIVGGGEVDKKFIQIESGSIEYTILALTLVAAALFITLYLNKFQLARKTGIILLIIYFIFICLAVSSEMVFIQAQNC